MICEQEKNDGGLRNLQDLLSLGPLWREASSKIPLIYIKISWRIFCASRGHICSWPQKTLSPKKSAAWTSTGARTTASKMPRLTIPEDRINLRLILVSGKTKDFLFRPSDSAGDIAQYVFDHWPQGNFNINIIFWKVLGMKFDLRKCCLWEWKTKIIVCFGNRQSKNGEFSVFKGFFFNFSCSF